MKFPTSKLLNKIKSHIGPASLLILLVCSCMRHASSVSDTDTAIHAIDDSMRDGRMEYASRTLREMKQRALEEKDSLLWARLMVQQAVMAYYTDDPSRLITSADSAAAWLQANLSDSTSIALLAKALQCHGAYFDRFQYNQDSACIYQRRSLGIQEMLPPKGELAVAYGNYANAMRMRGSLDSAAFYYHRALMLADSLRLNTDDYISITNGMAGVFTDLRDFEHSTKWWQRAMSMIDDMGPYDTFNTMTGYGNDLYYRKEYERSKKTFTELARYLADIPEARWERMFTDVNLADTYLRLGDPDKASALLDSTLRYFTVEQPNPVCLSYIQTLRMREASLKGDYSKTERLIAENPVDENMRPEQLLARMEFLKDYYKETGQTHKALISTLAFDSLQDSLRSSRIRMQISAQNAIYARDTRILSLQTENDRNRIRIFRLWMIIGLAAAAILIVLITVGYYRTRLERRNQKMIDKIMALRNENLKNRITPHFIYNAINHIIANKKSDSRTNLDKIVRLLRHQQSVAQEMTVSLYDELAFVNDYVSVMSENVDGTLDYTCTVDSGIDPSKTEFPSMAIQILVENAFKHSFAKMAPDITKRLAISVSSTDDDSITVGVFNNIPDSYAPGDRHGSGLRIVMETIRIINERRNSSISFHVEPKAKIEGYTGYLATITIPKSHFRLT